MKPVYFFSCCAIVTHPDQLTIIELRIEKSIHNHASLDKSMYGAILASA